MIKARSAALILLLEGLASSGLQMITIRQTVPFVGSSVLTTSIVISCFLGALALGYYWGGKQSNTNYVKVLATNLVISIGLFGMGLSYLFVSFFFKTISEITIGFAPLHSPLVHLTAFCLLVMSPLVFFLAQTVPLLLHTSKSEHTKSEAAGNATAVSTIGNVVGCLFTSLFLMFYFGVGTSIFINCLVLTGCLFLISGWRLSPLSKVAIPTAFGFLFASHILNIGIANQLFETTTPYSNLNIQNVDKGKMLVINRSSASYIGTEDKSGWPYIELMKDYFEADANMNGKDVLVLGAGGFTLSAASAMGANFTYIDVDEELKTIAEDKFLMEPVKGKFIVADARNYLLTNSKKWDYIVVDLYSNAATIPMHTATSEFFQLVQSRLTASGKSILNIAANPHLSDDYSRNMDYTVRSSFDGCITDITSFENRLVNILYFCSPKQENFAKIRYSDDTTRVAVDGYRTFFSSTWKSY